MLISQLIRRGSTQGADAAGILFLCNGRVLIVKRAPHLEDPELWSIPGGVLRPYERPWAAARRETVEECGSLPQGMPLPRYRYTWENPESENIFLTFIVELPPTTIDGWKVKLNEEHTAYQWAAPEDLKEKSVHPGLARVLSDDAFDHPRKRHSDEDFYSIQPKASFRQAGQDTIDERYIKGIRAGWKKLKDQTLQQVKAADGYAPAVLDILGNVKRYIERLHDDLMYNKGLFSSHEKSQVPGKKETRDLLIEMKEDVYEKRSRIEHFYKVLNKGTTEYELEGGRIYEQVVNSPHWQPKNNRSPAENASRTVENYLKFECENSTQELLTSLDSLISNRLLRTLTTIVKKWGPMEFGTLDREFALGGLKVTFSDLSRYKKTTYERDPNLARHYIKPLQKTYALLKAKKLDFLWYGRLDIRCKDCGGANAYDTLGKTWSVGGHYESNKDLIVCFVNPDEFVVELMAHELGHRYYYKFMNNTDRATFDSYFGEVSPVSDYGGTVSAEDFAEVFAYYVLNRNLTRDQLERFKKFLGRKRGASISQRLRAAADKAYWQDLVKKRAVDVTKPQARNMMHNKFFVDNGQARRDHPVYLYNHKKKLILRADDINVGGFLADMPGWVIQFPADVRKNLGWRPAFDLE